MKAASWCAAMFFIGCMAFPVINAFPQSERRTVPEKVNDQVLRDLIKPEENVTIIQSQDTVRSIGLVDQTPGMTRLELVIEDLSIGGRSISHVQSEAIRDALDSIGGSPDGFANPEAALAAALGASESGTTPTDIESMKKALAAGAGSRSPRQVEQLRQSGMVRLQAAREKFGSLAVSPTGASTRTLSTTSPEMARKTPLLPLPSTPAMPTVARNARVIEKLSQEIEEAEPGFQMDRLFLRLAAAHVGDGDFADARAIYVDLAQNASSQGVRDTARINLQRIRRGN